eukprot:CAMPEP_0178987532 /NCGR_PEP_ID=MMETSP0795-20121207/3315_1 /TAXON_ID=88552 /ORGANISM="Amoebophrya sp., Strain Ameob2" /LENGTH=56 /DNA_ID=CAMNT_0020678721 /DNA_START=431 /DNA_END=597 /DNA_ORIENTATION=-
MSHAQSPTAFHFLISNRGATWSTSIAVGQTIEGPPNGGPPAPPPLLDELAAPPLVP